MNKPLGSKTTIRFFLFLDYDSFINEKEEKKQYAKRLKNYLIQSTLEFQWLPSWKKGIFKFR